MFCSMETLGLFIGSKGGNTGNYRFKSLYVSQIRMITDLLPIKPQMAAILDLFLNENLKVTNSFRNEFSIKSHVK